MRKRRSRRNPDESLRRLSKRGDDLNRELVEKLRRGVISQMAVKALACIGNETAEQLFPEVAKSTKQVYSVPENRVKDFFTCLMFGTEEDQKIAFKCQWNLIRYYDPNLNGNGAVATISVSTRIFDLIENWFRDPEVNFEKYVQNTLGFSNDIGRLFLGLVASFILYLVQRFQRTPLASIQILIRYLYALSSLFTLKSLNQDKESGSLDRFEHNIADDLFGSFRNLVNRFDDRYPNDVANAVEKLESCVISSILKKNRQRNPLDENLRKLARRGDDPVRELLEKERAGLISPNIIKIASILNNPIANQLYPRFDLVQGSDAIFWRVAEFTTQHGSPADIKLLLKTFFHLLRPTFAVIQTRLALSTPSFEQVIEIISDWFRSSEISLGFYIQNSTWQTPDWQTQDFTDNFEWFAWLTHITIQALNNIEMVEQVSVIELDRIQSVLEFIQVIKHVARIKDPAVSSMATVSGITFHLSRALNSWARFNYDKPVTNKEMYHSALIKAMPIFSNALLKGNEPFSYLRNPTDDKLRSLMRRGDDPARELLEKERAGLISPIFVKTAARLGQPIAGALYPNYFIKNFPEFYHLYRTEGTDGLTAFIGEKFGDILGNNQDSPILRKFNEIIWSHVKPVYLQVEQKFKELNKREPDDAKLFLDHVPTFNNILNVDLSKNYLILNDLRRLVDANGPILADRHWSDDYWIETKFYFAIDGVLLNFINMLRNLKSYKILYLADCLYRLSIFKNIKIDRASRTYLAWDWPQVFTTYQEILTQIANQLVEAPARQNPDEQLRKLTKRGDDPTRELLEKLRAGLANSVIVKAAATLNHPIASQIYSKVLIAHPDEDYHRFLWYTAINDIVFSEDLAAIKILFTCVWSIITKTINIHRVFDIVHRPLTIIPDQLRAWSDSSEINLFTFLESGIYSEFFRDLEQIHDRLFQIVLNLAHEHGGEAPYLTFPCRILQKYIHALISLLTYSQNWEDKNAVGKIWSVNSVDAEFRGIFSDLTSSRYNSSYREYAGNAQPIFKQIKENLLSDLANCLITTQLDPQSSKAANSFFEL